ncbi:MAG TPA: YbhB/YbcL family Raf kinase inhibitor-like protein [Archaeoglobaceae archaeon]|nr:YbhB/YbcL family Raf kinase inhibitor-like protein [Archaeoglobaceae archaeon]
MRLPLCLLILAVLLLTGCAEQAEKELPETQPESKITPEETKVISESEVSEMESPVLKIESIFNNGGEISSKYTCDGMDVSPPLQISGVPDEAKTVAIIVDDPDAPVGVFTHWVIWNIPAEKTIVIPENIPKNSEIDEPIKAFQGKNDFGKIGYNGPCPPSGEHRYFFKVYALNTELDLRSGITKEELLRATEGHVIQYAELFGVYSR